VTKHYGTTQLYTLDAATSLFHGQVTISLLWGNMAHCVKWEISKILLPSFVWKQLYFGLCS